MIKALLIVAGGSALGGVLRFLAVEWITRLWPNRLPVGTILVNISGSLLIGFLVGWARPGGEPVLGVSARQFLLVGVLGGYTTFSAFSLQSLQLLEKGDWAGAVLNIAVTVIVCLLAVGLGSFIARLI